MKLFPKLLLTTFLIGVIGVAIAAVFFFYAAKSSLQAETGTDQLKVTSQTMSQIDDIMYDRATELQELAGSSEFVKAGAANASKTDLAAATAGLVKFRTFVAGWSDLQVLNTKGVAVAATEASDLQQSALSEAPQQPALYQKALSGQTVYSDVLANPATGAPTMVFMAPIGNTGSVTGVVAGEITWSAVTEILRETKGADVNLLDHNGLLIADNQTDSSAGILQRNYGSTKAFATIHRGKSGWSVLPDLNNAQQQTVMSYAPEPGFQTYRGNGWFLAVSTSSATLLAPARNQALGFALLFAGLIIIVLVVMLFLLNRQVMRPVKVLTAAVTRVALGDLSQTVPVASKDEIGALSSTFNEMTQRLGVTHRALQETTQVAQDGQAQLESSINGLRQGFILTNAQNSVIMANAAAQEMVHSAHPAAHASHARKLKLDDLEALLPKTIRLGEQIKHTLEVREQAKFSALPLGGRFLNIYLSPVVSGTDAIGCVLLLEDVTEERILERSRDEFFSIASHELRTPLTAIRGNTDMMLQYYPKPLKDPELKEMVNDIHESSVRLITIVNDFLDMSRLEQDKMTFTLENFKLEPVMEKVIYELASMSRDKKIYLKFDQNTLGELPEVYADQNRVKQVLYNLIGNAMKFTQEGGVTVNCLIEKPFIKICISDTGPGISPEGQQLLFHKFQQTAESILTRVDTRGTGLGLYISRLLVKHMNGDVKLEHSELGKGTTFSFTLPLPGAPKKPDAH